MIREAEFCLWMLPVLWLVVFANTKRDDLFGTVVAAAILDAVIFCTIHGVAFAWSHT